MQGWSAKKNGGGGRTHSKGKRKDNLIIDPSHWHTVYMTKTKSSLGSVLMLLTQRKRASMYLMGNVPFDAESMPAAMTGTSVLVGKINEDQYRRERTHKRLR
jgi:hypothetical protein